VARAVFYFDLGSPYAYLTSARIDAVMPAPVDWQPISLGALFKLTGRSSWSLGDRQRREAGMAEVERRAREYGLPPLRWPDPWPGNYLTAMRAAIYAQRAGRLREFADNAYRIGFQRGLDLSLAANVLTAAGEAGLDEGDVEQAMADPEIKLALREATDAAHALGVCGVPTVAVGGELFWGDDRLQDAAARSAGAPSAGDSL
jgi:2-hydroxychromene-2-carboxylate isomerase